MKYSVTYQAGVSVKTMKEHTRECEAFTRGEALNLVERQLQNEGLITRLPVNIYELDDTTPII